LQKKEPESRTRVNRKFTPARQVLNLAYKALQHGNAHEARYWAQIAAWMIPDEEDAWLILAAVAKPKAASAYLKRVLAINPKNTQAREDLARAIQQLDNEINPAGEKNPARSEGPALLVSVMALELVLAVLLVLLLITISTGGPGTSSSALAAFRSHHAAALVSHAPPWWRAVLEFSVAASQPTVTPTTIFNPSATATPTPTATPSPTPLPSSTPTFTDTTLPTNTIRPSPRLPAIKSSTPQRLAGDGQLIVVSISEQHLYAYQGGTLIDSFIVSTGIRNSTHTGTFHILDKLTDPYSDPWGFWMPDWMGIYYVGDLEDGFHALPVLPGGQHLWGEDLGTPASYGCIVLSVDDAQTLYNWAQVGTTVQINP